MSETANPITLGDQVRLTFLGWPDLPEGSQAKHSPLHRSGDELKLSWNNRSVSIRPGTSVYTTFELAKNFFGDPRSIDGVIRMKDDYGNDMIVPDRAAEVIRLRNYWQSSDFATPQAQFREYLPGDKSWVKESGISDMMPEVQVHHLNGERMWMVSDDPFGDHVMVTAPTRHESETMRNQLIEQSDVILELKKQNALLMEKLGIDPASLRDPEERKSQDSALTTPTDPVVEEKPKMVYNPRSKRVTTRPQRPLPTHDPTDISDLPEETD